MTTTRNLKIIISTLALSIAVAAIAPDAAFAASRGGVGGHSGEGAGTSGGTSGSPSPGGGAGSSGAGSSAAILGSGGDTNEPRPPRYVRLAPQQVPVYARCSDPHWSFAYGEGWRRCQRRIWW